MLLGFCFGFGFGFGRTGSETQFTLLHFVLYDFFPIKILLQNSRIDDGSSCSRIAPDPTHFLSVALPVAPGECRTSRTNLIKTRSQLMNQDPGPGTSSSTSLPNCWRVQVGAARLAAGWGCSQTSRQIARRLKIANRTTCWSSFVLLPPCFNTLR